MPKKLTKCSYVSVNYFLTPNSELDIPRVKQIYVGLSFLPTWVDGDVRSRSVGTRALRRVLNWKPING